MQRARAPGSTYAEHRHRILFFTLLGSLGLPPLLRLAGVGIDIVEGFLALNLLAAVLAVEDRRLRLPAVAVAVLALAARPGAAWLEQHALSRGSLVLWSLLALAGAASALRFALRGREVGPEQVYAALSTYLLAGLFFGVLYWVLERHAPGSLTVGGAVDAAFGVDAAIYYSFVTLASLGYGDVLPVSEAARGLAVVEVVGGQLYLAAMVARLVGAWR